KRKAWSEDKVDNPEIRPTTQKPSSRMSILLFFILLVTVICTAAVVYLNSKGIDIKEISIKDVIENRFFIGNKDSYEIECKEIEYGTNVQQEFVVHKDFIVRCTKSGIEYFDKNGEEKWLFPVTLNKPYAKSSGKYLLVADLETKDIYVFSGKEKIWEDRLGYSILSADINSNGYVTVVHRSDRNKSAVSVYNREGAFLFTKIKGEAFVISAGVSQDTKNVFVNSVDYSGINANTGLDLYSISGGDIKGTKFENTILASLWFLNDATIAAAGDSEIFLLRKDLEVKWRQTVSGEVMSSNIMKNKYAVFAFSNKENSGILNTDKSNVLIVDENGRKVSDYKLSQDIVNISCGESLIAVNTGKNIYFIDVAGQLRGSVNSEKDIKNVQFFNDREALAVTRDGIIVIKMK
ncbi:MAG TPA: DUF5711 family protein, partial [Acetivibrio sp.]|nr:DUF5711 family protein [Acetivibrio sp.]